MRERIRGKLIVAMAATVILLIPEVVEGQDGAIDWQGDKEAVQAAAEGDGRPLLIYFTEARCQRECPIANLPLSDPGVVAASWRFHRLRVDCTQEGPERPPEARRWMEQYGVTSFPTLIIVESGEGATYRFSGSQPAGLLEWQMLQASGSNAWADATVACVTSEGEPMGLALELEAPGPVRVLARDEEGRIARWSLDGPVELCLPFPKAFGTPTNVALYQQSIDGNYILPKQPHSAGELADR